MMLDEATRADPGLMTAMSIGRDGSENVLEIELANSIRSARILLCAGYDTVLFDNLYEWRGVWSDDEDDGFENAFAIFEFARAYTRGNFHHGRTRLRGREYVDVNFALEFSWMPAARAECWRAYRALRS